MDAVATDILNRHELQGNYCLVVLFVYAKCLKGEKTNAFCSCLVLFLGNTEMNPGLLAIYNEERERREVKGQLDVLHPPSSPG